jgi:hypothetical protein
LSSDCEYEMRVRRSNILLDLLHTLHIHIWLEYEVRCCGGAYEALLGRLEQHIRGEEVADGLLDLDSLSKAVGSDKVKCEGTTITLIPLQGISL